MIRHATSFVTRLTPTLTPTLPLTPILKQSSSPNTFKTAHICQSQTRLLSSHVLAPFISTCGVSSLSNTHSTNPSLLTRHLAPTSSLLSTTDNSPLLESRRWMVKGASARIGRPIKLRTMRHREWWARRKTRFYDHDSKTTLSNESKDFVQDVLREDYQGDPAESSSLSSPLKDGPWEASAWETEGVGTRRCGVLALKIGVVPQWLNDGTRVLCTMFQILDCHVVNYTSPEEWDQQFSYDQYKRIGPGVLKKLQEKRGVFGVQTVGALTCDPQRFSPEYSGLFTKAGILPKRKLTRFFVTHNAAIKPGTELTANHFRVGDKVIVEGRTIGHGFEGVMIRWGFRGGPADSHGTTKFHRKPGNIGCGRKRRSVNRGKKLPGHMGNEWRTGFNLKIIRINTKYNVLYVKGTCPGPPHAVMRIFDSNHRDQLLRLQESQPPLPTHIPGVNEGGGGIPDENGDIFDESIFDFSNPSISYSAAK